MKSILSFKYVLILTLSFIILGLGNLAQAADRYSVATGNWNATSTWSATTGGSSGASVPVAGDNVFIEGSGRKVTITAAAACASITIGSGNTLESGTFTLTVSSNWVNNGTFTPNGGTVDFAGGVGQINAGSGTANFNILVIGQTSREGAIETLTITTNVNCASMSMAAGVGSETHTVNISSSNSLVVTGALTLTTPIEDNSKNILSVGSGSLTCGSISLGGGTALATTKECDLSIGTGTVTVTGDITTTNVGSNIKFTGAGKLYAGGTFMSGVKGTLTPGTGTVIFDAAGLQTITPFAYTFDNVTIAGSGTKSLGAATIISGVLTINNGTTLDLSNYALGSPTGVVMYNGASASTLTASGTGTLTLGGDVTVNYVASGTNAAVISAPIALGGSYRTFTVADNTATGLTISSVISGTGGVVKTGTGTLVLSGNNSFTGIMNINGGILKLGATGSGAATPLGQSGSGVTVTSGALDLAGFSLTSFLPTTLNGTGVANGGAIMNSGAAATYGGLVTLGSSSSIVGGTGSINISNSGTINGNGFGLTIGGASGGSLVSILGTGSGTLTKEGTGTWTVSGASTFTGITTISAGTLKLTSAGTGTNTPLGTSSGGTSVISGATLDLNGITIATSEPLTINGAGVSSGALINGSATAVTYNGAITLGSAATISTTGNITLTSGGISGANDLTKIGGGTLNLGNGTCALGALTINTGTLVATTATISLTGNFSNSGSFNHNGGTVTMLGPSTQNISGSNTFNNLTISKTATGRGVSATSNQTIQGTIDLGSYNHSGTIGSLDMGSYTLIMGATAATLGNGDVTGIVKRTSFLANIPYTFGNQFTTINLATGGTFDISVKIVLANNSSFSSPGTKINRYYDIAQNGGTIGTILTLNLHYLSGELSGATQSKLDLFDYHVTSSSTHDHGHSNSSMVTDQAWVGLANLTLGYIAPSNSFSQKYWTLGTSNQSAVIWTGADASNHTNWGLAGNWTGGSGVPTVTDNVIIPGGLTDYPVLTATSTCKTITIQSGAVLHGGSGTLTITGGTGGDNGSSASWENLAGTAGFDAGTSTVIFTYASATMADPTNFYNVTVATGGNLTLGTDNVMRIAGALTLTGSLNAYSNHNTVEFNGNSAQTIPNPTGGGGGYHILIFSGSGAKTLPVTGSWLKLGEDWINNTGSTLTAGDVEFVTPYATDQEISGSKTSFANLKISNSTGAVIVKTNTDVTGTLTMNGSGTLLSPDAGVVFNGSAAGTLSGTGGGTIQVTGSADLNTQYNFSTRTLSGLTVEYKGNAAQNMSTNTTYYNVIINNPSGVTLTAATTLSGSLTLASGKLSLGSYFLSLNSNYPILGSPGNSNFINYSGTGKIKLLVNSTMTSEYLFPIGMGNNYSPATFKLTSGILSSAYLLISLTESKQSNIGSASTYLNRNWTFTPTNITSPIYDATFTYLDGDVVGIESLLVCAKYSGSWTKYGLADISSNKLSLSGANSFGAYTAFNDLAMTVAAASPICPGQTDVIFATVTGGKVPYTYSWTPVQNNVSSFTTTALYSTTTFYLTVTDASNATVSSSTTVTVYDPPTTATVGPTQNIVGSLNSGPLGGNSTTGGTGVGTGTWTIYSGTSSGSFTNAALANSAFIGGDYETYVLRWSISNGLGCTPSYADVTVNFYANKTSVANNNWNDPATWLPASVPLFNENVIITHSVHLDNSAVANSNDLTVTNSLIVDPGGALTVNGTLNTSNATLTVNSDAHSSGSLILIGEKTGKVTYNRYMTFGKWHLISSPVEGQSLSGFIANSNNKIDNFTSSSETYYGLADYDEPKNLWNGFFKSSVNNDFASGKGYEIRRETSDGLVSFTGTPVSNKSYTITKTVHGWNCIGNPFTSAIGVTANSNSADNFLSVNSTVLDPSYGAIYVWVEGESYDYDLTTATYYRAITNAEFNPLTPYSSISDEYYVQAGQGFFVKSKDAEGSVEFTQNMQLHLPYVTFKSGNVSWPGLSIIASLKKNRSIANVTFYQGMTNGLDPTYDAGLLRSDPDFVIYTRLVEDNGVDFTLQCLPNSDFDKLVVPIGLDCKAGGQVTFSSKLVNLDGVCKPMLEDRQTGILTDLSVEGATYIATIPANNKGIGRFYLRTSSQGTGIPEIETPDLNIYSFNQEIHVEGMVNAGATAHLFDLSGKSINVYKLKPATVNIIHPVGITTGVYLFVIREGEKTISKKLELN